MNKRIPPQATEIEESILGTMLIERSAVSIVMDNLKGADFYDSRNQIVFHAIQKLYMNNTNIDLLTIEEELKDSNVEFGYLADLTRSVASSSYVEDYCNIVKNKSILRKLINGMDKAIESCYKPNIEHLTVVNTLGGLIDMNTVDAGEMVDISEAMQMAVQEISRIQETGDVIGYRTGLSKLDYLINSIQTQKFYLIGARPSMGKTAFALSLMRRLAKNGVGVGILSLETSINSLSFRLLSSVSGVQVNDMIGGKLNKDELSKLLDAGAKLSELKIALDDSASLTDVQLKAKCRRLVSKHDCKVIFVDYLQLLSSDAGNREQEIAQISRTCKIISKEMDVAVVALAQLSRNVENRSDKRPMLSDLRDSGQIEQDADVVMFLYRPEYYDVQVTESGMSTNGLLEVIVAKQKDGPVGVASLHFDKERMSVENRTSYDISQPSFEKKLK